jgi:hypothetical protein
MTGEERTMDTSTGPGTTVYAVTATVEHRTALGWTGSRQVPTFYLNPQVQGITSAEHAERIAREIIDPMGTAVEVHVFAALVAL